MALITVPISATPTPNPSGVFTLDDLPFRSKVDTYTSSIDALALSCCNYRINKESKKSFSLTNTELHALVQPCDHELAANIRLFYGKRFTIWNLKGIVLSEYRKKLALIIEQPSILEFTNLNVGVIYRLPDFYEYDRSIDALQEKYFSNCDLQHSMNHDVKTLQPVAKFIKNNKLGQSTEYWFTTTQNQGVSLKIENGNNLQGLWDKFFNKNIEMKISAKFRVSKSLGFKHFTIVGSDWEMV